MFSELFLPAALRPEALGHNASLNEHQFYLGPAGSGASVHFHTPALNVLVHGRKRWYMLPPKHALYSKRPITPWLADNVARLRSVPPGVLLGRRVFLPVYTTLLVVLAMRWGAIV